MPEYLAPLVATLLGTLLMNAGGWYLARSARRKIEAEAASSGADAAKTIMGTAMTMVKHWEGRVKALELEVDELRAEIDSLMKLVSQLRVENNELHNGGTRLAGQLESVGQVPVWRPPRRQKDS